MARSAELNQSGMFFFQEKLSARACACCLQVAETLPAEVLEKLHAPPKSEYPIIDPHTLAEADGFVFGFPTRSVVGILVGI